MLVERKINSDFKPYFQFYGCSHLYFINGYAENGRFCLHIGSKVLDEKLDILYEVLRFCLNNYETVILYTRKKSYIMYRDMLNFFVK